MKPRKCSGAISLFSSFHVNDFQKVLAFCYNRVIVFLDIAIIPEYIDQPWNGTTSLGANSGRVNFARCLRLPGQEAWRRQRRRLLLRSQPSQKRLPIWSTI